MQFVTQNLPNKWLAHHSCVGAPSMESWVCHCDAEQRDSKSCTAMLVFMYCLNWRIHKIQTDVSNFTQLLYFSILVFKKQIETTTFANVVQVVNLSAYGCHLKNLIQRCLWSILDSSGLFKSKLTSWKMSCLTTKKYSLSSN